MKHVHSLRHDLGLALKSLAGRPWPAALGTLTLALAIGANSALFAIVDHVLWRPLPFDHPERLVQLWESRQLVIDYSTAGAYPYEVVGVVNDVRFHGLRSEPRPELYLPHAQRPYLILNIAIKVDGDPAASVQSVERTILSLDPDQPAHSVPPLAALQGGTIERERLALTLVAGFALAGLALAVLGVFGVLSYRMQQRAGEIGVRVAVDADPRAIFWAGIGQGAFWPPSASSQDWEAPTGRCG